MHGCGDLKIDSNAMQLVLRISNACSRPETGLDPPSMTQKFRLIVEDNVSDSERQYILLWLEEDNALGSFWKFDYGQL